MEKLRMTCIEVFSMTLTLIFVMAKLFGMIDWSWWIVFSPIWAPIAFVLFITMIIAIMHLIKS